MAQPLPHDELSTAAARQPPTTDRLPPSSEQVAVPGTGERATAVAPAAGPAGASLLSSPLPAESRYRALRFHARGGLGEVHIAEDTELHREVALKRIQDRHAD